MEFAYVPPPDDLDDCSGLACSIDMRSACHATLYNGFPQRCLSALCGLRRFASREQGIWLDVSRRRLAYHDKAVDLPEEEFLLLAAVASGRGHFVPLGMIAEAAFGLDEEDGIDYVLDSLGTLRTRLWSAGLPEDMLELDRGAGLKLCEETGD